MILKLAGVLALGAMVQSATGFGIVMMALPLLLWLGLSLPQGVALLLGGAVVQTAWGSWRYRAQIEREHLIPIGASTLLAVPLGVVALGWVDAAGEQWVRSTVSVVILLCLAAMPWRSNGLPSWSRWITGLVSGFLGGLVGMAGPPLVIYGLCHDWERDRYRVFLWSQMLVGIPMVCTMLVWRFGPDLLRYVGMGVAFAPVIWVAFQLATWATRNWDQGVLRRVAMGMLVTVAVLNIV